MKAFTFVRPASVEEAAKAAAMKGSVIKAGGIDLLDRMKERVDEPDRVVWIGEVKDPALRQIRYDAGACVTIGALVTLAELAASADVRRHCPALAEAAGLAASPQLRQRATLAGNLAQRTRCGYFRHLSFPCFKRGDDSCPVLVEGAVQDNAAIFGNTSCASAHPSSLAPVLAAFGAAMDVARAGSATPTSLEHAFLPPKRGVDRDLVLGTDDIIVTVRVPVDIGLSSADVVVRSAYEEVRQKAAFDWALVSCGVRLDMKGDSVDNAGIWLGSVAPTPWHAEAAEKALIGKKLTDETIAAAAEAAVTGATPLPGNAYKVDLVKVVVRRALERLRAMK